ncbi:MAG: alpha-ketoglutarate-dependent dioxygenase AlkB [Parafilimonas sp.]|nr:alpha-ketoglutarate-dependent dioxygenase AlkB [Parafilimonas sp.]
MNTLFPLELRFPEGFTYYHDFLSEEEETKLVGEISKLDLQNMHYRGYTANRKTASFGYDYNFENNSLNKGKEIPSSFNWLIKKTANFINVNMNRFAEMLVTEYPPGAVINWHRDVPQFDLVAGISLLADCTFKLRPYDKAKQTRSSVISFPVQRRSLYAMMGSVRWNWQHSIAPVPQTRYSITLRTFKT